jgi:NADH-quinone oxidoreductase subunit N
MENLAQIAMQNVNLQAIMPSLVLCCFGLVLLMVSVFSQRGKTTHVAWLSILALVVTGFVSLAGWNNPQGGFADSVLLDNFATFFSMTCIIAAALTILMSDAYLKREGYPVSEYYPLILFTTAGAMWMASGTDLMTIFLGLEVLSVSLYILAGFFRGQLKSNEAGLKYFFLGAFSTGFLLYGVALLYGVTGTTKIAGIAEYVSSHAGVSTDLMFIAGPLRSTCGLLMSTRARRLRLPHL